MGDLPEVTEIRRLAIRPGDRLVVQVDRLAVSEEDAEMVKRRVRAALKLPDIPVVVIPADFEIAVAGDEG